MKGFTHTCQAQGCQAQLFNPGLCSLHDGTVVVARKVCKVPGCQYTFFSRGYCIPHLTELVHGISDTATCVIFCCGEPHYRARLCKKHLMDYRRQPKHFRRQYREYNECLVVGCQKPHVSRGYCSRHLKEFKIEV